MLIYGQMSGLTSSALLSSYQCQKYFKISYLFISGYVYSYIAKLEKLLVNIATVTIIFVTGSERTTNT